MSCHLHLPHLLPSPFSSLYKCRKEHATSLRWFQFSERIHPTDAITRLQMRTRYKQAAYVKAWTSWVGAEAQVAL